MSIEDKAVMPLADYQAACNAIRNKTGTSGTIKSGDMASKINAISAGVDVSDTTATAARVLNGYYFYTANGTKTQGTIPSKTAATYNVSRSTQTISSGQYLSGTQTIKGVTTSNLSKENIRAGVVVKVGDADDAGSIANIIGEYSEATAQKSSGSFTGGGSNSASVSVYGMTSSKTLLAWGITGSQNQDAFYMGSGSSGTGSGVFCKTNESAGWTVGSCSPTCSLGTGTVYFGTGSSSCSFKNGSTYYYWVVYS